MKQTILILSLLISFSASSQPVLVPPTHDFKLGRWIESETELRLFLKTYPVHPDRVSKLWELSRIYIQASRFFEAETLLSELSSKVSGSLKVKAEYWLARSCLDYDRYQEALQHLEIAMNSDLDLEEIEHAQLLRVYVLARLERWKASEFAAKEFLDKYPDSDYANYASLVIADSYFHQQQYEKTIDDVQLLIPLLNENEEIERSNLLLAESYAQLKKWKDAVIFYGKLESDFPESGQIDWIRFRLAYSLMKDGQRFKAEEQINKIPQTSFLLPFKKALQIEIWKNTGSLDKIIESDFQVLSGQPLLSVYNLNHRIWAASKLEKWNIYRRDLMEMEKQPLLFMPLDSMWAQLGQLSFENKNYGLSGEAYQRSINFNKRLNKTSWPEIYYNAGLAFFNSGKFEQSLHFFDEFTERFPGNSLTGDAFIYSLICLRSMNEFDSLLVRISKNRDKYSRWYDIVDLMESEILFETGREKEGLDLVEKKIRYAQTDSMKTRALYIAAKLKLVYGRPDLALSNIRVLTRFYPQYFPSEVELMQIFAEYQIQSFAYLTNRIRDYRSKFGISGDQILLPVEINLLGKRGELTPEFAVNSIQNINSVETVSYVLNAAKEYLSQADYLKVIGNPKVQSKLIQIGEPGLFVMFYLNTPSTVISVPPIWSQMQDDLKLMQTATDSIRANDPSIEKTAETYQNISSEWIRQHLLVDFVRTGNIPLMSLLLKENNLNQYEIDKLKMNLSWSEYANLPEKSVLFLLEQGSKPTPDLLKLHFFGGISKFHDGRNDGALSKFYRDEAMKVFRISNSYIELETADLMADALKNDWDSVEEKREALTIPLPQQYEKKLDDLKLRFDFQTQTPDEFLGTADRYSVKYSNDRSSVDSAFVMQIKSLVSAGKDKKKRKLAKSMAAAYIKKNPKSEVVSEIKKLVR